MSNNDKPILIGSTFPLSLVRRRVAIEPHEVAELRGLLAIRPIRSFWGHANTLPAAKTLLGTDLTPATERPALTLNADALPTLDGETFNECWVVSPDYTPGFRPQIGEEVPTDKIRGWQVLRIEWMKEDQRASGDTDLDHVEKP